MEVRVKDDKLVEEFVNEIVDSMIMWELLIFLWNNPGVTDNADGIAGRLGRRQKDLVASLEKLSEHKILEKWGDEQDTIYIYNPEVKWEKAIEKFVEFSNNREGKLIIWSKLLKKGVR